MNCELDALQNLNATCWKTFMRLCLGTINLCMEMKVVGRAGNSRQLCWDLWCWNTWLLMGFLASMLCQIYRQGVLSSSPSHVCSCFLLLGYTPPQERAITLPRTPKAGHFLKLVRWGKDGKEIFVFTLAAQSILLSPNNHWNSWKRQ